MQELVLATRNAHKVAEVTRVLAPLGLSVVALPVHVVLGPEDGDSYRANALIKARAAARSLGGPVIADDSGIESEALGGRPGVRSARYAGEDSTDAKNLAKLVSEVPAGSRLRYVCAVAYVEGTAEHVVVGECSGAMAPAPRGENGFGYDPVFVPAGHGGLTMAELSQAQKDAISHRGNALRAFARWYLDKLRAPSVGAGHERR
jgi:XTP/dITP diphosphohydrolase